MTCEYGGCQSPADVAVYAAYDDPDHDTSEAHPAMRRYPMPMARACRFHVVAQIEQDQTGFGATKQYVVVPLAPGQD